MSSYADRVKQTITTEGTGAYDISGVAPDGFQKFNDVFANTNECYYAISMGADYEVGLGTIAGTTLVRTTIIDSSNSGSAVNWGAGSKTLFNTIPASHMNDLENYVDQDVSGGSSPTFDNLQLGTSETGSWSHGQIRFKDVASGLVEDLDETGVSSPLVENTFKVSNASGGTITRMQAVHPTGATGSNPTVDLADPADINTCQPVGLIRSTSINNNASGYVTTFGKLGNCDTSGFSEGDRLYLSTTAGELTTIKPAYPNVPVRIGVVARSHATEGLIIIDSGLEHDIDQDVSSGATPTFNITDTDDKYNSTTLDEAFTEIGETRHWNGFDRQDVDSMGALSWDSGTRTASIAVAGGQSSYHFWVDGKKVTKTTTESVVVPDVSGVYYVYFNGSGVLTATPRENVTADLFHVYAITHLVRWNAVQGSGGAGHEQHGIRKDGTSHMEEHLTIGAVYESGINIEGLVDNTTTYTQTTSGYFWDEDIRHTVDANATGHIWMYRLGDDGLWTTAPADLSVSYNGGSGDTYWNENTGTTWQLTRMTSSADYAIVFFAATPSLGGGNVVKIMGHGAYSSRTAARNAIATEHNNLELEGLPSTEIVFLYAVIVRRNGDLENLADGSVYYDLREQRGAGGGGVSAGTSYATDIPATITNFDGVLSSADTNVQLALDTIDDHVHLGLVSLETTNPASPVTGDVWLNTTDNQLKFKTATGTVIFDAWQYVAD